MKQYAAIALSISCSLVGAFDAFSHEGHDHETPSAVWPDHHAGDAVVTTAEFSYAFATLDSQSLTIESTLDPRITSWMQSDGTTGSSTNTAINNVVGTILADVNTIAYDNDYVYIRTTGIPSHAIGPFGGNPSVPGDIDATYRITLNPTEETGTRESAAYSLGNIGIMLNGVGIYGPWDSTFWRPQQNTLSNPGEQQPPAGANFRVNALWRRASGMDDARGHPSPVNGQTNDDGSTKGRYHYHMFPESLVDQLDPGNTGTMGSPIIGFAYDGYAIVGPYAYEEQGEGSLSAVQMTSSYGLIDDRASLGFAQTPSEKDYELGSFIEDFEYKPGSGNLNAFNMAYVYFDQGGRAVLTDETNEDGQWAYFLTLDVINAVSGNDTAIDGDVAWPYIIGPEFYGVYDPTPNRFTVPNDVTFLFDYSAILPGDMNGDSQLTNADIAPFVLALTDPDAYAAAYPGLNADLLGDFSGDGALTNGDIAAFVAALTGGQASALSVVPEPTGLALLGMGGVCVIARHRRSAETDRHVR